MGVVRRLAAGGVDEGGQGPGGVPAGGQGLRRARRGHHAHPGERVACRVEAGVYHTSNRTALAGGQEVGWTRAGFQQLANERIADAKALLASRRWAAAYYLVGYAVECGLKSCVLARVAAAAEVIFEDRRFSEKCWTHSLMQLVELAGVKAALNAHTAADPDLLDNWDVVKDWSESSRYARMAKAKAEELYDAITDKKHGVLAWVKRRW